MIYLELFLSFLKVSCFAFGGAYGAIPLIRETVLSNGWLTDSELSYMIAVSESTPGPIIINLATYIGSSQAGFIGAAVATLGVLVPCFVIFLIVSAVMKQLFKNKYVQSALKGLKPCIIGLILATGVYMIITNLFSDITALSFDIRAIIITAILALVMFGSEFVIKKKPSPIFLIGTSALLGVVIYR